MYQESYYRSQIGIMLHNQLYLNYGPRFEAYKCCTRDQEGREVLVKKLYKRTQRRTRYVKFLQIQRTQVINQLE